MSQTSSFVVVRTVLDGTLMVPLDDMSTTFSSSSSTTTTTTSLKTISDLKNYLSKLKGYDRSVQHIYQNGTELNDQANLNDFPLGKGFVLMIPISHSTRKYKTQKEVEAGYVASLTMNEINRQASTSGGSVSDQLEQIMAEFTSTHPPQTSTTGSTTSPSATTRPPTLTSQTHPRGTTTASSTTTTTTTTTSGSTTTPHPPRSTTSSTTSTTTGATSQQAPPVTVASLPVSEDLVAAITELGFSRHRAKKALILNDLNVEQAVEWIFNNIDSPYVLDSEFTPQELVALAEKYKNMMSDE